MKLIDNTSQLLGDDLKGTLARGSRIKIAASCFSICGYQALKSELSKVEASAYSVETDTHYI
jgi:hypothetical protein